MITKNLDQVVQDIINRVNAETDNGFTSATLSGVLRLTGRGTFNMPIHIEVKQPEQCPEPVYCHYTKLKADLIEYERELSEFKVHFANNSAKNAPLYILKDMLNNLEALDKKINKTKKDLEKLPPNQLPFKTILEMCNGGVLDTWEFSDSNFDLYKYRKACLVGTQYLTPVEKQTLESKNVGNMVLFVKETDSPHHTNTILVLAWNHKISAWKKIGYVQAYQADLLSRTWPTAKGTDRYSICVGFIEKKPENFDGHVHGNNIVLNFKPVIRYYPKFMDYKDMLNVR